MQFGVLGPLYVEAGDSDIPLVVSAPRLRTVLAVLLWRANQPVPVDELADRCGTALRPPEPGKHCAPWSCACGGSWARKPRPGS